MKRAEWWDESRRNSLLGHGIRWGHTWGHITAIVDSGPGALSVRPLCGGIQSVLSVDTGMDIDDEAQCMEFRERHIDIPLWTDLADLISPKRIERVCPRCVSRYNKWRSKAVAA